MGSGRREVSRRDFLMAMPYALGAISGYGRSKSWVAIENFFQPGTKDWLLKNPATNREIEGFASAASNDSVTSVNLGDSINFYVSTDSAYKLEIFRTGWYRGLGGRKMWWKTGNGWVDSVVLNGRRQREAVPDPYNFNLVECGWDRSYSVDIPLEHRDWTPPEYLLELPNDWLSGVYLCKLTAASGKQSYMKFVVRDDSSTSDVLHQICENTSIAYNPYVNSLYQPLTLGKRAYKVSLEKPSVERFGAGQFLNWEIHMVRFLEQQGYDVTYSTNHDTHIRGDLIRRHPVFLSVGHDEYYTARMRDNIEAARDAGTSLMFAGANNCYWQVRYENSSSGKQYRTMVCFKENRKLDPFANNPRKATAKFRDPPVNRPEGRLLAVAYDYEVQCNNDDLVINDDKDRVFEGTGLTRGVHLERLVGYEADALSRYKPANVDITLLGHSPYSANDKQFFSDMIIYRMPLGNFVFSAGSIQLAWGLESVDFRPTPVSGGLQRMFKNLFAEANVLGSPQKLNERPIFPEKLCEIRGFEGCR
ncbi:MAG: N,N-dimethylformamidase beta subunit family domain-containing protein [Candidatus Aenigmatarchaeota archaeon]